jgi:hypothetical protein
MSDPQTFDYAATARRALERANAAGDDRAARVLAACLPRPLSPAQSRQAHADAWGNAVNGGAPRPGVTRIGPSR